MNLSFDGFTHNTSGNLARCLYFFLAYSGLGKIIMLTAMRPPRKLKLMFNLL